MSEIQLSPQLMQQIQQAIIAVDAEAEDAGVALQYLAAISGYLLGTQNMPAESKHEFLDQLHAFARHVMDDVSRPQPASPPPQQAFGIWEPKN